MRALFILTAIVVIMCGSVLPAQAWWCRGHYNYCGTGASTGSYGVAAAPPAGSAYSAAAVPYTLPPAGNAYGVAPVPYTAALVYPAAVSAYVPFFHYVPAATYNYASFPYVPAATYNYAAGGSCYGCNGGGAAMAAALSDIKASLASIDTSLKLMSAQPPPTPKIDQKKQGANKEKRSSSESLSKKQTAQAKACGYRLEKQQLSVAAGFSLRPFWTSSEKSEVTSGSSISPSTSPMTAEEANAIVRKWNANPSKQEVQAIMRKWQKGLRNDPSAIASQERILPPSKGRDGREMQPEKGTSGPATNPPVSSLPRLRAAAVSRVQSQALPTIPEK